MSGIDGLLSRYAAVVSLPWEESGGPPQRVWLAVYHPHDERRLRARIDAFGAATEAAGLGFRRCDVTRAVSAWLGPHRYRDSYFRNPLDMRFALGELRDAVVASAKASLASAAESDVAAVVGVGALLGFLSVPELADALREAVACRLLVFFPGSAEAGALRFLEGREPFTYPAAILHAPTEAGSRTRRLFVPRSDAPPRSGTVLDALAAACARAAEGDPAEEAPPAAVLWPDRERQFERLLARAGSAWPGLLTLGERDGAGPAERGPAVWLRCRVDGTVPGAAWPGGTLPVVYVPGVAREQLRASEAAPVSLAPLADLRFRGVVFEPGPGVDWTLRGLLADADVGPGLDLPDEPAVAAALEKVAGRLGEAPLERLAGRRITPADLHDAVVPDHQEAVAAFLDDPRRFRQEMTEGEWEAFRSVVSCHFGFDPEKDGPKAAAHLLARRGGAWALLWSRFEAEPGKYRGLVRLLERQDPARPDGSEPESSWPGTNRREEEALRSDLGSLEGLPPAKARALLPGLAAVHRRRRAWPWAKLGQAPLAMALSPLGRLARAAGKPLAGETPDERAASYAAGGWEADAAAVEALSHAGTPEDGAAIAAAIRVLSSDFQAERAEGLGEPPAVPRDFSGPDGRPILGECVVVVPELPFEAGQRLRKRLEERGLSVEVAWRWACRLSWTEPAKLMDRGIPLLPPGDVDVIARRAVTVAAAGQAPPDDGPVSALRRLEGTIEALADRTSALLGAGWSRVRLLVETAGPAPAAFGRSPAERVVPVLTVEAKAAVQA